MELDLAGRSVLVTGASKGIGRAVAGRFAAEGALPTLVARTAADLERAATDIEAASGIRPETVAADLGEAGSAEALFAERQVPDILVNNAGAIPFGDIARIDEATWREAWELKVFGYINLCRIAAAAMEERGSGVIINIIGAGGERPSAAYVAGGAGNAALMALTRALGARSLRHGVRVVGINPGLIFTERLESSLRRQASDRLGDAGRWRELVDQRIPPGEPDHIAAMTVFLASDLSGNTSGTIVTIDGGSSAR